MSLATHELLDLTVDWKVLENEAYGYARGGVSGAYTYGAVEIIQDGNHYAAFWFSTGQSLGSWLGDHGTMAAALAAGEDYVSRLVVSA